MRYPDQFPVGKHDARTFAAIVENHVDPSGDKFAVEVVGSGFHGLVSVITQRTDDDFKWRNRVGPDDAFSIVVLFDCSTK